MAEGKILVVDDVKIVCMGVEAELGDAGFDVQSAYSGKEAVEKAKKEKFDIAFIDLVMPEMDGVETCQKIKEINPATEVVLISGHPKELEEKRDAFLAAGGAEAFLRKPFQEGELLNVAKKILAKPPQALDGDLVSKGKDFLLKGEFADAIGFLKKAIETNPEDDKVYSFIGEAYLIKKDYLMAILAYGKSSKINPKWAGNYLNQGVAYAAQGLYDKAIEMLKKAIEQFPKYAEAYRELGQNLAVQGKNEEAISALKKAVELNPHDEEAEFILKLVS
ncbi:MAG: response regulator [bacterium]